jgi:uncharacterized cupin superfamily protein
MPAFRPHEIEVEDSDGPATGPSRALLLSDTGGLTQFGAFVEILPPGSRSALKHWHRDEDELVHVLAGTVDLHEGASVTPLHPGDTATFRAGDPAGHCLVNTSGAEARYLVIGTRAPRDRITYPDDDRVLEFDRASRTRVWTDHAGRPADSPYRRG